MARSSKDKSCSFGSTSSKTKGKKEVRWAEEWRSKVVKYSFWTVVILFLAFCAIALSPKGINQDNEESKGTRNIDVDMDNQRNQKGTQTQGEVFTCDGHTVHFDQLPVEVQNIITAYGQASLAHENGDFLGALKMFETCLEIADRIKDQERALLILQGLWHAQTALERYDEALLTSQRMLQVVTSLHGKNDPRSVKPMYHLAKTLLSVEPPRPKEAIKLLEKARKLVDLDGGQPELMWAHVNFHLADVYYVQGIKGQEAKHLFRTVWKRLKRTKGEERFESQDSIVSYSAVRLATILLKEGQRTPEELVKAMEEALNVCRETFDSMRGLYGEGHEYAQRALGCLAKAANTNVEDIKDNPGPWTCEAVSLPQNDDHEDELPTSKGHDESPCQCKRRTVYMTPEQFKSIFDSEDKGKEKYQEEKDFENEILEEIQAEDDEDDGKTGKNEGVHMEIGLDRGETFEL